MEEQGPLFMFEQPAVQAPLAVNDPLLEGPLL
jgi:hypothetical protein